VNHVPKVLVIDDDPPVVRFVQRALQSEGHEVVVALDSADGLRLTVRHRPQLVLLGTGLAGLSTNAVLAALLADDTRRDVIVLGSYTDVGEKVRNLCPSSVDFLPKPFPTAVLVTRVRQRLRGVPSPGEPATEVVSGDLRLELATRRLFSATRFVELSQREAALMQHLMRHPGKACSRAELLSEVWGYAFDPGSNVVDVTIARLRSKLKDLRIETVRNVGYALRPA
jgi:DNA-binding response OmpR family regulator